jgi:hypothetical protein
MGALTTIQADILKIKGALRSALEYLAGLIDTNIANIATNTTNITNYAVKTVVETVTADKILTAADSGKVFLIGTDGLTITLPATALGLKYTFINSGADGNVAITLSPATGDGIYGSIPNSAADSVSSGTDGKDFINTKGTANKGDRITIVADGSAGWYIVSGVGIWASES